MAISGKLLGGAAAILVVTGLAYIPAMRAGYIWDDDYYVTENETLRSADGLRRIWFEFGAVPQYYPLVHTSYWLEYRLWGLAPAGYHVVNILLHAANAVLLWVVLRRLGVPGAWATAAIFALHPVHVESVAWVTERKNTLAGLFYLSAALAYLRFAGVREPVRPSESQVAPAALGSYRGYALSLVLFICAMLSKTVSCTFPAAVLLVLWWKRGRVTARDLLLSTPFFAIGAALGLVTVWMERCHVGARGAPYALSLLDRCLVAGRALWFYAWKLVWPAELCFNYARWRVDAGALWPYLFPVGAAVVAGALWRLRRRAGRGPLVGAVFFGVTLAPALGFVNVYPMRYSFVADHFQYLASAGLIALGTGSLAAWARRLGRRGTAGARVLLAVVLAVLGARTFVQSLVYRDAETLYRDILTKNPASWLANNNLGCIHMARAQDAAAADYFEKALAGNPSHAEAHFNLGVIRERQGEPDAALSHYSRTIELNPGNIPAYINLGRMLAARGAGERAIAVYEQGLRADPGNVPLHFNLANALRQRKALDKALAHYSAVLRADPAHVEAHTNMAIAFAEQGRLEKAVEQFLAALRVDPANARVHGNLALAYTRLGNPERAAYHRSQALRLESGGP
ncbi:MAG: tetratricopeptide repeat protein [Kiritimatiellae bacterium]|nr:tetratricopeptide repeat protein [Kiritimatiellia bacterium]